MSNFFGFQQRIRRLRDPASSAVPDRTATDTPNQDFELIQDVAGDGPSKTENRQDVETAHENDDKDFDFLQRLVEEAHSTPRSQTVLRDKVGVISENAARPVSLQTIPAVIADIQPSSRIVFHADPGSPGADQFRYLRMRLQEHWRSGKLKSLLITSALPQEGKSTIALNLATALCEGGKRTVLLIEADLYNPSLSQQLGLEPRPGLAECLAEGLDPVSAVQRVNPLNWYLLHAGAPPSNPTELVHASTLSSIIQKLSICFDWVIIDSPPIIPITDALSMARQASATLIVAREGHTPREALQKAITLLGRQRVIGVVFNGAEERHRGYSGYYGYYGNSKKK